VGVYETNPPIVDDISFDLFGDNDYNISVTLSDETDTLSAKIILNPLSELIVNDVVITRYIRTLEDDDGDNTFNYLFYEIPAANYSVDIETMDAFWNEITYEGITILNTLGTNDISITTTTIFALTAGSFTIILAVTYRKRRK
jgi:hypothetical protein